MIRLNQQRPARRRTGTAVALMLSCALATVAVAQESNGPALLPEVSATATNSAAAKNA